MAGKRMDFRIKYAWMPVAPLDSYTSWLGSAALLWFVGALKVWRSYAESLPRNVFMYKILNFINLFLSYWQPVCASSLSRLLQHFAKHLCHWHYFLAHVFFSIRLLKFYQSFVMHLAFACCSNAEVMDLTIREWNISWILEKINI